MRVVTRVVTPESEDDLLNVVLAAPHVEKSCGLGDPVERQAEHPEDPRHHEAQSLRRWVDENGMVVVPAPSTGHPRMACHPSAR